MGFICRSQSRSLIVEVWGAGAVDASADEEQVGGQMLVSSLAVHFRTYFMDLTAWLGGDVSLCNKIPERRQRLALGTEVYICLLLQQIGVDIRPKF